MTPYGMSDLEKARVRTCRRDHKGSWTVDVRNGNYSAFNGGRFTPSDYSQLRCRSCGRVWRSNAAYIGDLPNTGNRER